MAYLAEPKVHAHTRWAYDGCPGVGTSDLMRAPYSPARGLVRMPQRLSAGRTKPPATRDGIGTMAPRSNAAAIGKMAYALRAELGERAYAELTGTKVQRTAKVHRPKVSNADIRRKADGGRPVVLSADELASILRRKAGTIRMGDLD